MIAGDDDEKSYESVPPLATKRSLSESSLLKLRFQGHSGWNYFNSLSEAASWMRIELDAITASFNSSDAQENWCEDEEGHRHELRRAGWPVGPILTFDEDDDDDDDYGLPLGDDDDRATQYTAATATPAAGVPVVPPAAAAAAAAPRPRRKRTIWYCCCNTNKRQCYDTVYRHIRSARNTLTDHSKEPECHECHDE